MDGITATVEIRRREGGHRHTPIIAVTANGNRERCLDAGMDDYLPKPVRQWQLAEVIAHWITHRKSRNSPASGDGTRAESEAHAKLEDGELNGTAKAEKVDAFSDDKISQRLSQLSEECGAEMVAGFVGMFVRDTAERLTCLHRLAAQQDVIAVEREAHNVKGSCANLGAERMAALCHQLETEAEAGSLGSADELLEGLDSEFERLKPLLGWGTQVL
jgi:two-component system sensor histidine kinase/response regulator